MGIRSNTKRTLPFFKQERLVMLSDVLTSRSLPEIAKQLSVLFEPEISNILSFRGQATVSNLRGRPTVANGIETGQEILLKIQGTYLDKLRKEQAPYIATVETRFKQFSEGVIHYTVFSKLPQEVEAQDLTELLSLKGTTLENVEVAWDFYENKIFPFLNIKLQELRERIQVNFSASETSGGCIISGSIENKNLQISGGFSKRVNDKISSISQIADVAELSSAIS